MRHISTVLRDFLPVNYKEAVNKILILVSHLSEENQKGLALVLLTK